MDFKNFKIKPESAIIPMMSKMLEEIKEFLGNTIYKA